MACRSKEKGEEAVSKIKMKAPDAKVEFMELDLQVVTYLLCCFLSKTDHVCISVTSGFETS